MNPHDKAKQAEKYEGWAFTFCKAAFLVLIFRQFSLLALSGLAAFFYIAAAALGVQRYRCWFKPPWVVIFWLVVFGAEVWRMTLVSWR